VIGDLKLTEVRTRHIFSGARRAVFPLEPGIEVGIGRITLIAESRALVALHGFLARLLGFGADGLPALDRALRAVRRAATRRGPLIVFGGRDLVSIAHGLHRRALGEGQPFVVCDPRPGPRGGKRARGRELRGWRIGDGGRSGSARKRAQATRFAVTTRSRKCLSSRATRRVRGRGVRSARRACLAGTRSWVSD
jgi:hypothetical protein